MGLETDEQENKHELININEISFDFQFGEPHVVVQQGHKCERATKLINNNEFEVEFELELQPQSNNQSIFKLQT